MDPVDRGPGRPGVQAAEPHHPQRHVQEVPAAQPLAAAWRQELHALRAVPAAEGHDARARSLPGRRHPGPVFLEVTRRVLAVRALATIALTAVAFVLRGRTGRRARRRARGEVPRLRRREGRAARVVGAAAPGDAARRLRPAQRLPRHPEGDAVLAHRQARAAGAHASDRRGRAAGGGQARLAGRRHRPGLQLALGAQPPQLRPLGGALRRRGQEARSRPSSASARGRSCGSSCASRTRAPCRRARAAS